jgi:hypothetical protein
MKAQDFLISFLAALAAVTVSESDGESTNEKCIRRRNLCYDIINKYYTEGSDDSWVKRRNTSLKTQCREGRQYNKCFKEFLAEPDCKPATRDRSGHDTGHETNEKLYKFVCVDEYNAFRDHLPCFLSDAIRSTYRNCFSENLNVGNCSAAGLYKCFEPAIEQTPECTEEVKPLLRKAANKLAVIAPMCLSQNDAEEEDDSDSVNADPDQHDLSVDKQIEKDGVLIKVQVQVVLPKGKKEKTRHPIPFF